MIKNQLIREHWRFSVESTSLSCFCQSQNEWMMACSKYKLVKKRWQSNLTAQRLL